MVIRRTIRWRVHFVEDNGRRWSREEGEEEDDDEEENEDDSRRTTKRSSRAGFATWTLAPWTSFLSCNGWRDANWNILYVCIFSLRAYTNVFISLGCYKRICIIFLEFLSFERLIRRDRRFLYFVMAGVD